jgi:uncharacterized protein
MDIKTQDVPIETADAAPASPVKRKRGFAAMDPARVREIARRGGQAAHQAGTAHEFTPEEARVAGRKGGQALYRGKGAPLATAPAPSTPP